MDEAKLKRALKQCVNAAISAKEEHDAAKARLDECKQAALRLLTDSGLVRFGTDKGLCELKRSKSYSVEAAKIEALRKALSDFGLNPDTQIQAKTSYGISAELRGIMQQAGQLPAILCELISVDQRETLDIKPNA